MAIRGGSPAASQRARLLPGVRMAVLMTVIRGGRGKASLPILKSVDRERPPYLLRLRTDWQGSKDCSGFWSRVPTRDVAAREPRRCYQPHIATAYFTRAAS